MAVRLKLPHNTRIITATVLPDMANFLLWAMLIAIISLNVVLAKTQPLPQAQPHPTQKQVLGATTTSQIPYWQNVIVAHPDYQDAYVELASLFYAQGNLLEARNYLQEASSLAPNSKTVADLLAFITKLIGK